MKRSHEAQERRTDPEKAAPVESQIKRAKKKQRKAGSAQQGSVVEHHLQDAPTNESIAYLDGPMMADYIARQTKRFLPDLSVVELEDLRIPERAFKPAPDWSDARTLERLASFVQHHAAKEQSDLAKAPEAVGAPHTIVLCSAALRAADAVRVLRQFQTRDATVAKMFAKHIKLKDAVNFTRNTRISIGVGTPQRILDLLDQEALSLEHLARIVVDASHLNEKQRGIFEMSDTEVPLAKFLAHRALQARYRDGQTSIIVY